MVDLNESYCVWWVGGGCIRRLPGQVSLFMNRNREHKARTCQYNFTTVRRTIYGMTVVNPNIIFAAVQWWHVRMSGQTWQAMTSDITPVLINNKAGFTALTDLTDINQGKLDTWYLFNFISFHPLTAEWTRLGWVFCRAGAIKYVKHSSAESRSVSLCTPLQT